MTPLFKKLNLKNQRDILVVAAPASFAGELVDLVGVRVQTDPAEVGEISFALAFVTQQAQLDQVAQALCAKAVGDAILWFVYPKKSSKKYQCEFDRDSGWSVLGAAGYEGVRMVAVDEDWSAFRFRKVEYIKSLQRDPQRIGSEEGRQRKSRENT